MNEELIADGMGPPQGSGRIEGGIDAVVVGATIDGLIAAAYLGRSGLKTVLLEAGMPQPELRAFTPGYFADDGDFLIRDLDPDVVEALDLYRHGLSFVQRRFDTAYFFSDQSALNINGDLFGSFESIAEVDEIDADDFQSFVEEMLNAANELRPYFAGEAIRKMSTSTAKLVDKYASASLDFVLDDRFENTRLKDLLAAEASLRSGLRPSDPHSFLSLLRRWSGEAAGLQGGCALPSGGYSGLFDALRRAVQSAGVEIRSGANINSVLVEWDGAAGVAMSDGGQIRAPVVVNALDGRTVFLDQIGPELIDIEFQRALTPPTPNYASAKIHFALNGTPRAGNDRLDLARRLVYVPDRLQLRRSFRMARDGEVDAELLMEVVFPSSFEEGWAPPNGNLGSGWVHPIPYRAGTEKNLRERVQIAALNTIEKIAPGAGERMEGMDVTLISDLKKKSPLAGEEFGGAGAVSDEARRAQLLGNAAGIRGIFFCGPQAQVGHGVNGAAGRRAGLAAIKFCRKKGAAA